MNTSFFDLAAEELERHTGWSRLAARGTLRIALKAGGLRPEVVTSRELRVVLEKVMPRELELRGVSDPEPVCAAVIEGVGDLGSVRSTSDADEVFQRLAGD